MPANLPPQYFEAEKEFRLAKTPEDKIAAIEEMLAIMPKHKGTDHLRAELRRRIAKLTQEAGRRPAIQKSSMSIPKEGAGQVVVIGLPNTGKSQLVATVTNAKPAVADYPFTTRSATPGMMEFENIQIQLIDTPPLAPQTTDYWMSGMLRKADALLIVIDLSAEPIAQIESVILELARMRIGIMTEKIEQSEQTIQHPKKALIAGNKMDLPGASHNFEALQNRYQGMVPIVVISARDGTNLEEMKRRLYEILDIIRVYTKVPGQKPDLRDPLVLKRGSTLEEAAGQLHKDLKARLKYARVWGSGKHDGVMVKRDHVLQDGDIIELHV